MQWTDLENYRQLLQDYGRRTAEYRDDLERFRSQEAEGHVDPEEKARLDKEFAELHELYDRLSDMRKALAETRDAALAAG